MKVSFTLTVPMLEAEIQADIDLANKLIMDMKDLQYISSAGLRLLLSLHKKMASKGGMVVKNLNESHMELLEFTGFDKFLTIE